MSELTEEQLISLTSMGECPLHYHSADRAVQHEQFEQLQGVKVIKYVIGDYTVSVKDDIIVVDTSMKAVTITLPLSAPPREYTIVRATISTNSNALTIRFSGGQSMFYAYYITLTGYSDVRVLKSIVGGYIRIG